MDLNLKTILKTVLLWVITPLSLSLLAVSCGGGEQSGKGAQSAETGVEAASGQNGSGVQSDITEGLPAVIDFYATWCGPCRMISPLFDQLRDKYSGKVNFRRVDVDAEGDVARQYGIEAMPTFVFLDASGQEVDRIVGADADALSDKVATLAAEK